MRRELYAGAMSGTSLDGVDAVVADFGPGSARRCRVLGAAKRPFPPALRAELLELQQPGRNEIARAAVAANALADIYAEAIAAAVASASALPSDVVAAGVHGQTLRHRPDDGWTFQLNNPARVAEFARMAVVADFRSRDVAAGGQGAPLVPAFHAALFGGDVRRVIVNLGGIANLTDLAPEGGVRGFDTGPGNVLLDHWHFRHRGGEFDKDGGWARSGRIDPPLLAAMSGDPFFVRPPPKSTGRDLFSPDWLDAKLAGRDVGPADVQATLLALTVRTVADAIAVHCPGASEVLVCGGGANNPVLMEALAAALAPLSVATTTARGVDVLHVEALAFAWLAREAIAGRVGNVPAVTGARGLRVLGAIYPR